MIFLRGVSVLVGALLAVNSVAHAQGGAPAALTPASVMSDAQTAYFTESISSLDALSKRTSAWAESPQSLQAYAYAYVQFRELQLALLADDEKRAKKVGGRCVDTLERLLKSKADFAEGQALLSACYGYLANLGGFAAIRNGSRSGKAIESALALAPDHARVLLINGFGVYFRPAFVGGDKAAGCQLFADAATAFEQGAEARAAALGGHDWGAAEAYYFKGRCARDAGDAAAAASAFARSVELAPSFKRAVKAATP